jgi:hypothetical protein
MAVLRELIKFLIIVGSLGFKQLRNPRIFMIALNSPILLPFFLFEYYRLLARYTSKTVRSTRLAVFDFFTDAFSYGHNSVFSPSTWLSLFDEDNRYTFEVIEMSLLHL